MIYLDHNATTPVDEEVRDAVCDALKIYGNPSSSHAAGREAHRLVEDARAALADLIGAAPEEIVFTSGGTESNNLAIMGYARYRRKGHIVSSRIEHPSVINPLRHLEKEGFDITLVGTDRNGVVSPEEILEALRADTVLVTIMHSNNETGVIQPVGEIAEILKERGIVFHTDMAQSAGKRPVDVRELGCDMATIVSHKFYGPKGIGALYLRKGVSLQPVMHGAGHERGLRPGTENIPAIAGFGRAAEIAVRDMHLRVEHAERVTGMLYSRLLSLIPDIRLNGEKADRLPNTLNVSIRGITGSDLVNHLKDEVAISAGSACHSGTCKPSDVLLTMGLSTADAVSAVRISTGKDTSEDDVSRASELIAEAVAACRT
ncbi:MAG: cysteine desulfurase [Nitrospirae bacterium]|nr:cysteine desulfurase [Nitrospirota bacterium]